MIKKSLSSLLFCSLCCASFMAASYSEQDYSDMSEDFLKQEAELQYSSVEHATEYDTSTSDEFCVGTPLPTEPSGQVWQKTLRLQSHDFVVKIWRVGCDANNSNVLVRIESNGGMFFCSSSWGVLQGGDQFDVKLTTQPGGTSFCDNLIVNKTFLLEQWSFDVPFNDDAAFTFYADGDNTQRIEVGAYNGQSLGCTQPGISSFSPDTGVLTIPSVQLPSGKCYNVTMWRMPPYDSFNFSVYSAVAAP